MTTYYSLHNSPTGELLMMSDGRALTDLHTWRRLEKPSAETSKEPQS